MYKRDSSYVHAVNTVQRKYLLFSVLLSCDVIDSK